MTAQLDITGSSDNGYTPRQLADFQTAINAAHALIVDPKTGQIPFQNNTDDTILQQVTAIICKAIQACDNAAAWLALMRDPATSTGALLSALVQLNGIIRKAGAPTVISMRLIGDAGTLVPAGSLIAEANGTRSYETYTDTVLDATGMGDVYAVATETGPYVPGAGTVVVVQTPIPGWSEATNLGLITQGTETESDAALRRRQQISTNATSYRQIEAIEAAVYNVDGVTFARTFQNRTLETDDRGIPGKTVAVVAVGGDEYGICEAISMRSPLGVGFWGNVSRSFTNSWGEVTMVRFSRPVEIPIWVKITLSIINDERIEVFPGNGLELIKEAIVNFAETGHTPCEPLGNTGFPPGQDIIRSYLYSPINSIGGARVVKIELSTDGSTWNEADMVIPWDAIGLFSGDRIEFDFE